VELLAAKSQSALNAHGRAQQATLRLLPDDFVRTTATDEVSSDAVSAEACSAAAEVAALLETGSTLVHPDTFGAVAVYEAAAACGNPAAQFTVGALAAVGLFGVSQSGLHSALMMHFAAQGQNEHATIAQAYRHLKGVGAVKDCSMASEYYKLAADVAIGSRQAAGSAPIMHRHQLAVEQLGGVAGLDELAAPELALSGLVQEAERLAHQADEASDEEFLLLPQQFNYVWRESMAQLNIILHYAYRMIGGWQLEDDSSQQEIVDYFRNQATVQGDAQAHVALGHIHYYGLRDQPHDYSAAVDHFMAAAEITGVLDEEGTGEEQQEDGDRDMRLMAMAMLGECYVAGRGVQRDVAVAMEFLVPAVRANQPVAMNAMAILVLQGESDYGFTVATFPEQAAAAAADGGASVKNDGKARVADPSQGITQDLDPGNAAHRRRVAMTLLQKSADAGHTAAMHNLALMHMAAASAVPHGMQPASEAGTHAPTATRAESAVTISDQQKVDEQRRPSARVWPRSFKQARRYFGLAVQQAYLPSMHALGLMHLNGLGGARGCRAGTLLLRNVVHRGPAALLLDDAYARLAPADIKGVRLDVFGLTSLAPGASAEATQQENHAEDGSVQMGAGRWASEPYSGQGVEALRGALLQYLRSAAMGFEIAQWNAATILQRFGAHAFQPAGMQQVGEGAYMSLLQLAAKQGNVEARLALGDLLHRGSPKQESAAAAAAGHYRTAADMGSSRAMYNLGVMHEHGNGLPVDFLLAKRYYDMARAADTAAWVPITIALERLRFKTAVAGWMQTHHEYCLAIHANLPYLSTIAEWLGFATSIECQEPQAPPQGAPVKTSSENTVQDKVLDEASSKSSGRSSRMSAAIEAANKRKRIHRQKAGVFGKVRNYALQAVLELKHTGRVFAREGWSSLDPEDRMLLLLIAVSLLLYLLRWLRNAAGRMAVGAHG